jgi:hypothetical protein
VLGAEQVVAPGDRGAQRPLPLREVAGPPAEQREAAAQAGQERRRRPEAAARRGEFDRQRDPIQPPADLAHGRGGLRPEGEGGVHRLRPLGEQPDGGGAGRRRVRSRRDVERPEPVRVLPPHAQDHPAGDQDRQPRAPREEVGEGRGGPDHLLEVVQHQEQVPVPERRHQPLRQRLTARLFDPQAQRRRGQDGRWVADGRQRDEGGPVPERWPQVGRHGEGQPGLADARWPGDGEQADGPAGDQPAHRRAVPVAPDEPGQRDRQRRRRQRAGRAGGRRQRRRSRRPPPGPGADRAGPATGQGPPARPAPVRARPPRPARCRRRKPRRPSRPPRPHPPPLLAPRREPRRPRAAPHTAARGRYPGKARLCAGVPAAHPVGAAGRG